MAPDGDGFVRRNAFLIAAATLPVVVIAFFLLATAVPRWFVEPPGYDLVVRAAGTRDQAAPRVFAEFGVRDGRLEVTYRAARDNEYPQRNGLFVFDHETLEIVEIPIDLPSDLVPDDPPRTVPVAGLEGRRVLSQARAPDGYALEVGNGRGPGLFGELFGIRRSGSDAALVKDGRVLALDLPASFRFNVTAIGWLSPLDEGQR